MEDLNNMDMDMSSMEEEFPRDNLNQMNSELLEKYNLERKHSEKLRQVLNKCQDERRELELKLVGEKALRDQESKNTATSLEKNNIQFNAQIYSMKCEVETWKQKAEATSKETQLLKEQLKLVELEKWEVSQRLSEITEKGIAYNNFRKSFDTYTKRIRDSIQDLTKQLQECQNARQQMAEILESYKREVDVYNVHIRSFKGQQADSIMEEKVRELEKSLQHGAEIKDMLLDKLTTAGIRQSELYARNMNLVNETQELNKKLEELNHCQITGRSISKEQWVDTVTQLESAESTLTQVNERVQKVILTANVKNETEN